MDYAYQGKHPPTKLEAMAIASNAAITQEQLWLADSAATDHVTSCLNALSFPKPYTGQDHLTVGNGQNLPITHIGKVQFPTQNSSLHLNNVLRVPSIASNLASVHKLCHDNNCWCYFDENLLSVQALATGKVLYQGRSEQGVYPIYPSKATTLSLPSRVCNHVASTSSLWELWHNRLGHPHAQVLQTLLPILKISSNKCNSISCTHCISGKIYKLPFPTSHFTTHSPLELVHSDVWGPGLVFSINKFRYYVLFVDHYTRFTWIYFLQHKSEVFPMFVKFKSMAETQFSSKLKTLRSDGGGEYVSKEFESYLSVCGILHQLSYPYTPQQNGLVEQKHRHIIETTITLLSKASLPFQY